MGSELVNLEQISQNISKLFLMIKILESQATSSFENIVRNQMELMALHANAKSLVNETTRADQSLQEAINNNSLSLELAQMAKSIANELSPINTSLVVAENKINSFEMGVINGMIDIDEIVAELEMLDDTLATFTIQLKSISVLADVLENATTSVREQAISLSDNIKMITVILTKFGIYYFI